MTTDRAVAVRIVHFLRYGYTPDGAVAIIDV